MKLYDVPGHDRPLMLSDAHAELLEATPHEATPQPGRNASADAWREWVIGRGVDPDAVALLTRTEIIESYGE